ncbi:hypothetical protein Ciccas_006855 [Cichlidogyrus casuarinus]|uniref:Uncharacterized protein n=1 Tax=Cichlidogyrus casuarinus TaxID=1844966 RepID=A0ABD2Q4K2_9PLAT
MIATLVALVNAIRFESLDECLSALENACILYFAFGKINYSRYTLIFVANLRRIQEKDERTFKIISENIFGHLSETSCSAVSLDTIQEATHLLMKNRRVARNAFRHNEKADCQYWRTSGIINDIIDGEWNGKFNPSPSRLQTETRESNRITHYISSLAELIQERDTEFHFFPHEAKQDVLRSFFDGTILDPVPDILEIGAREMKKFLAVIPAVGEDGSKKFWKTSIKAKNFKIGKKIEKGMPDKNKQDSKQLWKILQDSVKSLTEKESISKIVANELLEKPTCLHDVNGKKFSDVKEHAKLATFLLKAPSKVPIAWAKEHTDQNSNIVIDLDYLLQYPLKRPKTFGAFADHLKEELKGVKFVLLPPWPSSEEETSWLKAIHHFTLNTPIGGPVWEISSSPRSYQSVADYLKRLDLDFEMPDRAPYCAIEDALELNGKQRAEFRLGSLDNLISLIQIAYDKSRSISPYLISINFKMKRTGINADLKATIGGIFANHAQNLSILSLSHVLTGGTCGLPIYLGPGKLNIMKKLLNGNIRAFNSFLTDGTEPNDYKSVLTRFRKALIDAFRDLTQLVAVYLTLDEIRKDIFVKHIASCKSHEDLVKKIRWMPPTEESLDGWVRASISLYMTHFLPKSKTSIEFGENICGLNNTGDVVYTKLFLLYMSNERLSVSTR